MRRGAFAVVLAVAATLLPAPGGTALGPICAAAAGSVSVAVVVDLGDLGGNAPPEITCVNLAEGATGTAALQARARQLGRSAPRFSAAGFLCGVDGLPASGCGDDAGSSVAYWSYWWASTSTPTWRYATRGSDQRVVRDGFIEGWRYIVGTDAQGPNLAPRVSPATIRCDATVAPAPAPAPAPARPSPVPGAVVSPATATPSAAGSPDLPGASGAPVDLAQVAAFLEAAAATSTSPDPTVAASTTSTSTTAATDPEAESAGARADEDGGAGDEERSDAAAVEDPGNDGAWAGTGAAALVIAASAGLAVVQSRRRRLSE